MSQCLRLAVLQKDERSMPSTHIGELTTACSSSSRAFSAIFWSPFGTCTQTHIHIDKFS